MRSDVEFLGLQGREDRPGHFTFTVAEHLARLDGQLYGGTAIAVSVAASELVSDRQAVWMTTQFVSTVGRGTEVAVHAEVLAGGRRTHQVRVTGTSPAGDVVFASLGATALHRPDGFAGQFVTRPDVPGPDEVGPFRGPFSKMADNVGTDLPVPEMPKVGFMAASEMRSVPSEVLENSHSEVCLWARRLDRKPITAAIAAYLADMVPMGLAHALDVMAAATSLDNTVRIGTVPETEWVLLDIRPHLAAGSYGHGVAHVWSQDGHLMATASQTASMFAIDLENPPWKKGS